MCAALSIIVIVALFPLDIRLLLRLAVEYNAQLEGNECDHMKGW